MGIGAIFGAINTMYAIVSARTREIATLRALGFSRRAILVSFLMDCTRAGPPSLRSFLRATALSDHALEQRLDGRPVLREVALQEAQRRREARIVLCMLRQAGRQGLAGDVAGRHATTSPECRIGVTRALQMTADQSAMVALLEQPLGEAVQDGAEDGKRRVSAPEAAKPPPIREVVRVAEHGEGWGVPAEWD